MQGYLRDVRDAWRWKQMELRRGLAAAGWAGDASARRLASLRNAHRGRRGFIIGNGPSLRASDLDRLGGDLTFAANKIYLAYEETEWRPTYYAFQDWNMVKVQYRELCETQARIKFFPDVFRSRFEHLENVVFLKVTNQECYPAWPSFSRNPFDRVYSGNTVTYIFLQLALYMGIREVYLLGVDFHYQTPKRFSVDPVSGYRHYVSEGEISHFHPEYIKPGEGLFDPNLHLHETAYRAAARAYAEAGAHIYNATRGGKLDLFPRADFDRIVPAGDASA
jgi:hypothetical protein